MRGSVKFFGKSQNTILSILCDSFFSISFFLNLIATMIEKDIESHPL